MSWDIKSALSGGGAVLAAAAFLLGNMTGDAVHPVDVAVEIASSPADTNPCNEGWTYRPSDDPDRRILACVNGNWVVVLNPDGSFNYGLLTTDPNASEVFDASKVPGWER